MTRYLVAATSLACFLAVACGSAGGADVPTPVPSTGAAGASNGGKNGAGAISGAGPSAGTSGGGAPSSGGSASSGAPGAGGSANAGEAGQTAGAGAPSGGSTSSGGSPSSGGNGTGASAGTATAGSGTGGTPSTGGTGPSVTQALAIVPADATLSPPSGVAPQLAYHAILQSSAAPDTDVTAMTTFTVDNPSFGSFAGALFTAPAGTIGMANVGATYSGLSATTTITITAPQVVIGTGADANSPNAFGGPTSGDSPMIVYPPDGVLLPPNTNSLEIHFVPGAGQTLFALDCESSNVQLTAYFGCQPVNGGCVISPDATFWKVLANSARGGGPVTHTLRGVDGSSPGSPVGVSASQTMQFSTEDLSGGIYYWNSGGTIERYDFGYPGTTAETYLNAFSAGAAFCVGCHVISRDGTRIVVGLDIPAPSPFKMFDVATKTALYQQGSTFGGGANFFTFSPDTSRFLSSDGASIDLRDTASGSVLQQGAIFPGSMPDWSPDGSLVAYAKPDPVIAAPGVSSASIMVASWNGTAFSNATELVPFAGENNYYPAFSPDGQYVAFNRSPGNHNSFDNAAPDSMNMTTPDGQVWIVRSSGGTAFQLASASDGKGDQWVKWAPTNGSYQNGSIAWIVFSSRRAYGLRLAEQAESQLWMAAVDLAKLAAGTDGSFPAFWLPFQDIATSNHIAQWVTKVQRPPCQTNAGCGPGESCRVGQCVPDKP